MQELWRAAEAFLVRGACRRACLGCALLQFVDQQLPLTLQLRAHPLKGGMVQVLQQISTGRSLQQKTRVS